MARTRAAARKAARAWRLRVIGCRALGAHHRQWQWAIISDATWPEWTLFADSLHRAGIEVLVEVQSRNDFSRVTQLPADGVILKGNESGARIGDVSALVMLQQWKKFASGSELEHLPFWIQGGIGPNTAAGCFVTGARGVVLDSQLLLCRESPLVADQRRAIGALDGSETRVVGQRLGDAWRICPPRGSDVYDKLVAKEEALLADTTNVGSVISRWRDALDEETSAQENWPLLFVGQGIALARSLADRYVTVSGVIQAICQRAITNVRTANETQPLAPNAATISPISAMESS